MAVLSNGIWTNVVLSAVDSVERWTILNKTSNLPGVPHLWRRHGSQVVTAGVSRRAETAADSWSDVIHVIRSDTPLLRAALEDLEVIGPKIPPTKRKWVMLRPKITNFLIGLTLKNTPLNRHPSLTASSNPRLGPPCRGPEGKKIMPCPDHGIILRSLVVLVSLTMKSFGLCPGSDPCYLREIDPGVRAGYSQGPWGECSQQIYS